MVFIPKVILNIKSADLWFIVAYLNIKNLFSIQHCSFPLDGKEPKEGIHLGDV